MGSIGLRIALFVLGGVAVLSGGLKVRERARVYYGGFGLGLLEILAGMALMGSTVPGMATDATMVVLARLTGVLIVVSSTAHIFRARRLRRAREESEGGRLYSQIKYGERSAGS